MINIDDVKKIVASVGNYDENAITKYLSIIENAALSVGQRVKDESYCNDPRIVYLAGIKACNDISMAGGAAASGITAFKVGDISITEDSGSSGSFSGLYKSAFEDCRGLLSVENEIDDFAFLGV